MKIHLARGETDANAGVDWITGFGILSDGPSPRRSWKPNGIRSQPRKMYAQEDLGISFDDVAGIDEAVDELREVVEFLRSPEKYQILGGHIPKGVLLVGPPGTGKTFSQRLLPAKLESLFGLSGSDFVEMFVGVGAPVSATCFNRLHKKARASFSSMSSML